MTKFQKQVEVQGTKKLDNLKGVQVLELNEMKETEGGFIPIVVFGIAVSAKAVAGACVAAFGAGVGIGAVAYLAGR